MIQVVVLALSYKLWNAEHFSLKLGPFEFETPGLVSSSKLQTSHVKIASVFVETKRRLTGRIPVGNRCPTLRRRLPTCRCTSHRWA